MPALSSRQALSCSEVRVVSADQDPSAHALFLSLLEHSPSLTSAKAGDPCGQFSSLAPASGLHVPEDFPLRTSFLHP